LREDAIERRTPPLLSTRERAKDRFSIARTGSARRVVARSGSDVRPPGGAASRFPRGGRLSGLSET